MTSYLRIKICGITNESDGCQAGLLGADAIGLNFYEKSPRFIDYDRAQRILRKIPLFVEPVGVCVVRQPQEVVQLLDKLDEMIDKALLFRTFQLHREGGGLLLTDFCPFRLISAVSVGEEAHLAEIRRSLNHWRKEGGKLPEAILVDAHVPGQYGGTGRTAPWNLLADFHPGVPVILAGGLTPENVAEAVRIVRPYGVDVASGVEKSPGQKDPEKMKRFIENAREAAAK
jgi:phosphoribosylanthranilate isomerase